MGNEARSREAWDRLTYLVVGLGPGEERKQRTLILTGTAHGQGNRAVKKGGGLGGGEREGEGETSPTSSHEP